MAKETSSKIAKALNRGDMVIVPDVRCRLRHEKVLWRKLAGGRLAN
jgi:hypothetical protein